jgi:hypothetical protein
MYFKRHPRFRKADELMAQTERTYITLLPSLACCSVLLLTPSWTDASAYNTSFALFFLLYLHMYIIALNYQGFPVRKHKTLDRLRDDAKLA